jgi:hypothetical protein
MKINGEQDEEEETSRRTGKRKSIKSRMRKRIWGCRRRKRKGRKEIRVRE